MATTVLTAPAAPTGVRRPPWRSPEGQPPYARPALLVIVATAALLYSWGIGHSQFHTFYANAARSMSESWKAFFFGSFDPGNSITLDKLPGFLWPQALSARVFGFHAWALTLPQVIEGVLSVLVLHRVVRRWAGVNAALIAATAFLLTPVAAGLFRTAVEDPAFTLLVLLAADAAQRAAHTGRLRPLLLAGVWVGLAFQAKMLEAWAVLPALAAVYLMAAPAALRRRLGHLALAGVVTVAVSSFWMVAVALTPAQDRPYVDGTTDNSAFSMVVGYNFLNRFASLGISAASTGSVSATQGGGGGGRPQGANGFGANGFAGARGAAGTTGGPAATTGRHHRSGEGRTGAGTGAQGVGGFSRAAGAPGTTGATGTTRAPGTTGAPGAPGTTGMAGRTGMAGGFGGRGGQNGWGKMFGSSIASQTGWLYPMGAIAVVCGLLWRRGRPRTDRLRAGFVLWGVWLATYFLVFSAGSVGGHSYYMGVIAVPLAALTGGGVTLLWRAYRAGGARAWALPGTVAAGAVWSAYLAWQYPSFLPWLAPAVLVLGAAAVTLLLMARAGRRFAMAGLAAGLCALLAAPGAWAASVLDPAYGNSGMGTVGPAAAGRMGTTVRAAGRTSEAAFTAGRAGNRAGGAGFGGFGAGSGHLTAQQSALLAYTTARRGGARYVFATTSWSTASPYIIGAGARVLPIGGFTGRVPFPTQSAFEQLVRSGQLRYVLAGQSRGFGGGGTGGTGSASAVTSWVRAHCATVPAASYGGTAGGSGGSAATAQTLYDCAPAR